MWHKCRLSKGQLYCHCFLPPALGSLFSQFTMANRLCLSGLLPWFCKWNYETVLFVTAPGCLIHWGDPSRAVCNVISASAPSHSSQLTAELWATTSVVVAQLFNQANNWILFYWEDSLSPPMPQQKINFRMKTLERGCNSILSSGKKKASVITTIYIDIWDGWHALFSWRISFLWNSLAFHKDVWWRRPKKVIS